MYWLVKMMKLKVGIWKDWIKLKEKYLKLKESKSSYDRLKARVFSEISRDVEEVLYKERLRMLEKCSK